MHLEDQLADPVWLVVLELAIHSIITLVGVPVPMTLLPLRPFPRRQGFQLMLSMGKFTVVPELAVHLAGERSAQLCLGPRVVGHGNEDRSLAEPLG